jgi:DNA (cytosine-5)-methyltransferase 1
MIYPHDHKEEFIELESGLIVPRDAIPKRRPTCVDLFCGCGGMSLGVIQAGMEVVAAVEWDYAAAQTYLVNLGEYPCEIIGIDPGDREGFSDYLEKQFNKQKPQNGVVQLDVCGSGWRAHNPEIPGVKHFFIGNIRNLTGKRILEAVGLEQGELDLVCGGPPCQGFSLSNSKRSADDPRNSLVFEFVRLILEMMPKTMVMENVPQMAKMVTPWGTNIIDEIALRLEAGGWGVAEGVRQTLLGGKDRGGAIKRPKETKTIKTNKQKKLSFKKGS